jgi:hypothetical protein
MSESKKQVITTPTVLAQSDFERLLKEENDFIDSFNQYDDASIYIHKIPRFYSMFKDVNELNLFNKKYLTNIQQEKDEP